MFGKGKEKTVPTKGLTLGKDETHVDDLGPFPGDVDINPSKSRAQERALRSVAFVAIVSGMMNIALIMLLITLFPLQKVYPYLVTFKSQESQVVSIEPMSVEGNGMLYATEDSVRDYVIQRHTFVPIDSAMQQQWGPSSRLAARTGPELYAKFMDSSKAELAQMMTAGYTRKIDINSVQRIAGDTWQVNFTTHDTLPTAGGTLTGSAMFGGQPSTSTALGTPGNPTQPIITQNNDQTWIATMKVDYQPQKVTYDKRLLNPLGFTVTDYSVSRTTGK